jgi:hypothetical protein
MKVRFSNREVELAENWYRFFFPYLLRFTRKHQIEASKNGYVLEIPADKILLFRSYVETALSDLLEDCYYEPDHKSRSKHPSRYEKILFKNKTFVLNYRSDLVGMTGYGLFYLLGEVDKGLNESTGATQIPALDQ